MKHFTLFLAVACLGLSPLAARSADDFTRTEVIYGRKFGVALTLDIVQPSQPNGYGVIAMISGGFVSSHEAINPALFKALLDRGYTVFAVVHGAQPKFTIPEIEEDVQRASRWIHYNARQYRVDPAKLGVFGASAGGHLSLVLGIQGKPGDPNAKDPVDRESSTVGAVACFFPPTDFMNWGWPGDDQTGVGRVGRQFKPAFGLRSDTLESREKLGVEISPLNFVSKSMPPTLIIHGEADKLVPIYQSEILLKKATEMGLTCRLIRRPGKDHGWPGLDKDIAIFANWYDHWLRGLPDKPEDYK